MKQLLVRTGLPQALRLAWDAGPRWAALVVALNLAGAIVPLASAWATKLAIDAIVTQNTVTTVIALAAGLATIGVITSISPAIQSYATAELDRQISLLAQDRLYRTLSRLPGLKRFEDPAFLDRIRLAAQSGGMTPGQTGEACLGMLGGLIMVGGFLGTLLSISPPMTLLTLACTLPALLAEVFMARQRAATMWTLGPVERREFFYSQLLTSTDAAKEVRLFGLGDFLHQRMLQERRTANAEQRTLDRRQMLIQIVLRAVAATVSGLGVIWAMVQCQAGLLSIGDILMFIAAMAGVHGGTSGFITQLGLMHQHLLLFSHYQHVTGVEPDLPIREIRRLATPFLRIEFDNVWFRYSPNHPWVLRGVSFSITNGRTVGLVGLNGSGKSTLVKLLCRFYDPVHGTIRWDGLDIRDVDIADLRNRLSVVFQDFMQYDLSVAENIGLGDLALISDRDAISIAAKRAGVHDAVCSLPSGYDTLMTRNFFQEDEQTEGVYLSGGQAQRIAVARALLRRDRDLLILDEPSSGLDAQAEYELHNRLKTYRTGKASLLVSHRLNTLRDADFLIVIDDGVVAESGDHEHLMRLGGRYFRLFTMQAAGYQDLV
ncbi:ABC transporter ATP-binding protein [Nonomuraea sp. NPDC059007]|uniref:ABC transporter ATP-binding protein n=1 Tax=Nonomuraea sp. NPDC059007 TaxID=3346692 RepID=UPI0036CEAC47